MKRREFIGLLGGAAVAWPIGALAQSSPVRRIGVLMNAAATETVPQSYVAAFVQALRQLGWTEGQNCRRGGIRILHLSPSSPRATVARSSRGYSLPMGDLLRAPSAHSCEPQSFRPRQIVSSETQART
jgi:hypothetical protein